MDLTGRQIKRALEQQWQPAGASRPFLRLGVSKGFTYTYDPATPPRGRRGSPDVARRRADRSGRDLLGDGELVPGHRWRQLRRLRQRHRASRTPARSTCRRWSTTWRSSPTRRRRPPLPVDYSQRAVGVTFPAGCAGVVPAGRQRRLRRVVAVDDRPRRDAKDTEVVVSLDGRSSARPGRQHPAGRTPGFDEAGTAAVERRRPGRHAGGRAGAESPVRPRVRRSGSRSPSRRRARPLDHLRDGHAGAGGGQERTRHRHRRSRSSADGVHAERRGGRAGRRDPSSATPRSSAGDGRPSAGSPVGSRRLTVTYLGTMPADGSATEVTSRSVRSRAVESGPTVGHRAAPRSRAGQAVAPPAPARGG